jgi:hypothetical protein
VPRSVESKSGVSHSRVGFPGRIIGERATTYSSIEAAICITKKSVITYRGVAAPICQTKSASSPSAVLPPGYPPSGGGLTACARGKSAKQASRNKSKADRLSEL